MDSAMKPLIDFFHDYSTLNVGKKRTLLMVALVFGAKYDDLIKYNLSGSDDNCAEFAVTYEEYFSIHKSIKYNIEELVNRYEDVNAKDCFNKAALSYACKYYHCNPTVIEKLITNGADVDAYDDYGMTPLMYLLESCSNKDCLLLLIKYGADVNARDAAGETPLMYLMESFPESECALVLLENGADVNAHDKLGKTPLMYLFEGDSNVKCFLLFIRYGVDVNVHDVSGKTPLIYLLENFFNRKCVHLLLKHGADVNAHDITGKTPFMYLLENDSTEEYVLLFIKHGADVNACDATGKTALMYLLENIPDEKSLLSLIKHGADVNARDKAGMTPLMYSLTYSSQEFVLLLIKYGSYVKVTDNNDNCVLHIPKLLDLKYVVLFVYEYGVPVDSKNANGDTPLKCAVQQSCVSAVEALLLCGSNPNIIDKNSYSPVCYTRDEDILNILMYFGGKPFHKNNNNECIPFCFFGDLYTAEMVFKFLLKRMLLPFPSSAENQIANLHDLNRNYHKGFLEECEAEITKMKKVELVAGLTFYEFLRLKATNSDKFIVISPSDYLYSRSQIKDFFPLYYKLILMHLKFNKHEKRMHDLRKMICGNVTVQSIPCGDGGYYCDCRLNYDVFYYICRYLNDYDVCKFLWTHPAWKNASE